MIVRFKVWVSSGLGAGLVCESSGLDTSLLKSVRGRFSVLG